MSIYKTYAQKIPAKIREEMLELKLVSKAVSVVGQAQMMELYRIHTHFISSEGLKPDCPACMDTVLKNMKKILPELVKMQHQANKLKSI